MSCYPLYFFLEFGRCQRQQSLANRLSRATEQIAQILERQINTKSENFDQFGVGFRPGHDF